MRLRQSIISVGVAILGLLMCISSSAAEPGRRVLLKFASYDEGPGGKVTFQINRLDIRAPSAFLTLGEIIPGTHLKLTRFRKSRGGINQVDDVSQLELVDTQTGAHAILVMDRIVSIPFSDDPGLPKTK